MDFKKKELIKIYKDNVKMFAQTTSDIARIDLKDAYHKLAIDLSIISMQQKKRKFGPK